MSLTTTHPHELSEEDTMRGTRPSNQWKGEVVAATYVEPDPVVNPVGNGDPCDDKPAASANKAVLVAWLEAAGVHIEDPSEFDKSELWSLINDRCD